MCSKNEQKQIIEFSSPSGTIISPLTCSIQSSLSSSSSSSLFLPNDNGAMSTRSKGLSKTTQNEDESKEIHPGVDVTDQNFRNPAEEQGHAKIEENIGTFLTDDRLKKEKSFINFQRPRRKPLRDRSDIFQALNTQDGNLNPRMEFYLSPLHSQSNANTCRHGDHNGFQSNNDIIEDGFHRWDNSSPEFIQKKPPTLDSRRLPSSTKEVRVDQKTNSSFLEVEKISQWTETYDEAYDERSRESYIDFDETNDCPNDIGSSISINGEKGRRISPCCSLPLANVEVDLDRIKSNNTRRHLSNIFEDEPTLTSTLLESPQSCDEGLKSKQEQLDYISADRINFLDRVSLTDYEQRISPFRNVFEEMRSLRNENKRLNDENRHMAYTLQNQMATTMTTALEKKQELERELTDAQKTITNLLEKVKCLEGTHH
ncbi:hypothetical protein FRACYDRAFT_236894 [Fragilariopsis cylindrus CCMP1102]|uniref:Uncharacterized protein n=1 Tax=Fragilariopsis cylindrus CCMP1102 TaxID=635003 RepID=A0A1E7FKD2_9STRA|nr:hypothetical protein FRACYDRAFT_236894 [Fragilariopsis cylindrus CCMP1102]|eukprot:OEU18616.1 hypothetical protein FRACYDRAFT_236894 [Fragilariopsis cylindrus CCMP1102]